jgi:hypothetical protein
MSFYPILDSPECTGFTVLYNYPPNNWQKIFGRERALYVCWAETDLWHSKKLAMVPFGESIRITRLALESVVPTECTPFLFLTEEDPPAISESLPSRFSPSTIPNWRGTLGLMACSGSYTSYQGEVDPFPQNATLLTFGSMLQKSEIVENFFIFVNLENSPVKRKAIFELRSFLNPKAILAEFEIINNQANVIAIDKNIASSNELIIISSRNMGGIPLYFSKTRGSPTMSLEHTHPPASLVIHCNRHDAQRLLKQYWFGKFYDKG